MARNENVIVLGGGLEQRTNQKTGKQRFSVQIKSEPIVVNLNPAALGAPVAQAIAHHLRERMKGITETASPATLRSRKVAAKAFAAGEAWALKRYAGGKMGARPPGQSGKSFNDSGRMIESIVAALGKDGVFRINVAGNRLDPRTATGGAAGVVRIWEKLVSLIPEFADMGKLMQASDVIKGRMKAQEKMIQKANSAASAIKMVADMISEGIDLAQNAKALLTG